MINLIQNLDNSFSKSYNDLDSLFLLEKDNSFFLPLEESPKVKNNKNKNLFITKKTMKEKIEQQKIRLGKETKEIFFDKKEDLKRRNREAAQNSRNKKKLELIHLLEENKMLKDKIYLISSKINLLCSHCKNFFEPNQIENNNNICVDCSNNDNNNIELDDNLFNNTHNTQSSSFFSNLKFQKIINFTLIGLFSLLFIFCLFTINLDNYTLRNNLENINKDEFNISLGKNDLIKNINETSENKKYENDFFNSFQCKKRSFTSIMLDELDNIYLGSEKDNNNIDVIKKEKKGENRIKNPIYFKLFIQSCSWEEEPENNINKENKDYYNIFNKHYIFSTDKSTYKDYYFFCKEIDN